MSSNGDANHKERDTWWRSVASDCERVSMFAAELAQGKFASDEDCKRFIRECADQLEGLADTWTDDD